MVNKKGWLRIVEVVAALLIIFAAVLIVIDGARIKQNQTICSKIPGLLDEIAKNQSLREDVFSNNKEKLDNFVLSRLNNPLISYQVNICDVDDLSGCLFDQAGVEGDVCAGERILSTTVTQEEITPKKIKIFLYKTQFS